MSTWMWIAILLCATCALGVIVIVAFEERRRRRDRKPSKIGPTVEKYNAMLREHYNDATLDQLVKRPHPIDVALTRRHVGASTPEDP